MKKSLLGLVGLCLAQATFAQKPSGTEETYRRVEATFSQAADVESLRDNPQFMAELKKVIGAADGLAAKTIVDHSTFVFMNGLLADVGAAIGKMPKAVLESVGVMKAPANMGLRWHFVTDLKGFYSPWLKEHGIDHITQNFLIDRNGMIIGRNLFGKDLEREINKLFN